VREGLSCKRCWFHEGSKVAEDEAAYEYAGTPRSLRVSFEFQVPRSLRGVNIRDDAVQKTLDTFRERVIGMSEGLFPWATELTFRKQWVYNWTDHTEVIPLQANAKNTAR
jgi:hypothetical protein